MQCVGKLQFKVIFFMLFFSPFILMAKNEDFSSVIEGFVIAESDDSMDSSEMIHRVTNNYVVVRNNISMVDTVDEITGIITKGGARFIHNGGTKGIASNNTFMGIRAGRVDVTGKQNSGFGANALRLLASGTNNTAFGSGALRNNQNGNNNTAVGAFALNVNNIGTDNVAIGRNAGVKLLSGNSNIFLGANAGSLTDFGAHSICIGNPGLSGDVGVVRIGNLNDHVQCFIAGIINSLMPSGSPVVIDANGKLGISAVSSSRFKRNINTMNSESERIYDLHPVTFVYRNDELASKQFGFIAEEVDAVFHELVIYEADGQPYAVRYEVLPVLIINEMQKQKQVLESQQQILESQKQVLEAQQQDMHAYKQDIDMLLQAVKGLQEKLEYFMVG